MYVSRAKYVRYFGDTPGERVVRRIGCRLPWFVHRWPVVGAWVHHWTQISEVLQQGCLNPAIVLDAGQGLVAVFTNLSNCEQFAKPVVRIIQERLHLIDGGAPPAGTRLAAACVYWRKDPGPPDADWDDFSAIVVDCLVGDPGKCREAQGRIKPMAWKALDASVASLPRRDEPGLFPATVPSVLVRQCY
jgi:hypothetical protein